MAEHTLMASVLSITTGTQMSDLVRDDGGAAGGGAEGRDQRGGAAGGGGGAVVDHRAMLVAFKGLPFVLRNTLGTPIECVRAMWGAFKGLTFVFRPNPKPKPKTC